MSHAVTVPPGRGGGRSGGPSGQTRTVTGRGPPEWNRQTTEAMAELGALEAMAELGALEAMAGCLRGLGLGPLGPAPTAGTLSTPPKKISLGYLGGIKSPLGLNRQDKTGTGQLTGTGSPPGLSLEAEASSGHDEESGALTGSLSKPLPSQRQGGRRLEWPPWPQQEEPPAPDESPRTRQGYLKCSCGHNKTDTRHSWP